MEIPDPQLLLCLGFLVAVAMSMIAVASFRFRDNLLKSKFSESLHTGDAAVMPVVGSVVLFTIYVILRFIPREYFNVLISLYLSIVSIFALGSLLERYVRPNILTGSFCVTVGAFYFWTKNWVANDVLAFAVGVSALEMVPVNSFGTSFVLLIGLFIYDIFWVFGSDVMLTVATGVDGPIKMVFPKTVFGPHTQKSLLGLGDIIVPGFFICQTLVFSWDVAKRGNFYFKVALVAYFFSLVNTMVVMIVFEHGQPALLFIVPWLLVTFTCAVVYKGDARLAWSYDALEVAASAGAKEGQATTKEKAKESDAKEEEEDSLFGAIASAVLHLFGFGKESTAERHVEGTGVTAEKKNS